MEANTVRVDEQEQEQEKQDQDLTLRDFLSDFGEILKERVRNELKPVFDPFNYDDVDKERAERLAVLKRKLFPSQEKAVLSLLKGYDAGRNGLILCGEMGVGKTLMGLATAYLLGARRVLVMCPSHLVQKWIREAKETIPDVRTVNLNGKSMDSLIDLKVNRPKPKGMEVWVLGKERAKLHYQRRPGVYAPRCGRVETCPRCGVEVDPEAIKALSHSRKAFCEKCGEPLFQPSDRFRRYSKAEFIKRYLGGMWDLFIADEVHELKGGTTAQGQAFADLACSSKRVLAMTGTLMGGYSTNLFYLLWRLMPRQMRREKMEFGRSMQFAKAYGVLEKTYSRETSYNQASIGGTRVRLLNTKEKPGISPLILTDFLLERTVFLRLSDVATALPSYEEEVVTVDMLPEQEDEYKAFEDTLVSEVRAALARGDHRLLGKMINSLFAYPDGARRGETVVQVDVNPLTMEATERVVAEAASIDAELLPKEEELLELLRKEIARGRKCLVCLEHTGTRDLIPDLKERIEAAGFRPVILRSTTTDTENREAWLKKKVSDEDFDVLITNPRLIQTGLDLLDFPSMIFFQTGYSIFTLRQASRRSWRIGQDKDVRVFYMAYGDTVQEKALKLIASKLETALAVEGDLSDKGLSALANSESSMLFALARELLDDDDTSVQDVWNSYKKAEVEGDAFMGEPDTVETVTTTFQKGDRKTSVTYKHVLRGIVYPKVVDGKKIGVAVVGKDARFVFYNGKVFYKKTVVGRYNGLKGVINHKPIGLRPAKGKAYYMLYEIQEVRKAA